MTDPLQSALDHWAGKADASPNTGEVLFSVTRGIFDEEQSAYHGDPDRPFFLASATKLFVTVLMVQLRAEGALDWDEPFLRYLPEASGLHVADGIDRTSQVTVRHLMSHTSGLADYFEDKRLDGSTIFARMLDHDFGWDLADVLRWTREDMTPRFPPGTKGKAHYSDTNYQLLGGIIERRLGMTFAQAVAQRIADPLGLSNTYCCSPATLDRYDDVAPFRDGHSTVRTPLAMASFGADGGMVSTLRDGQRFLRAFFDGTLIPFDVLQELCRDWRTVFYPIRYGTGVMRFQLPLGPPGQPHPPLDGHSGASGVVMYLNQGTGTSIVGTVNQVRRRSMPYRVMQRVLVATGG